ncbi:MAG: rRNA maturation RNase YbeY [Chryseosolibacter sp.]
MARINFFDQDISFKIPKPQKTRRWILDVISREKKQLTEINYILCSDEYLLSMNKEYLNHKTLTDIITFDNSEIPDAIEGDIFISIERVQANAVELATEFDEELHRVLIHGVLHLIGYGDNTPSEKKVMRKKEDAYLSLRSKL